MAWLLAVTLLVLVAVLLRWVLALDSPHAPRISRLAHLGTEREALYRPIGQEVGTQSAILGISLNDAIDERDAGQTGIAWRLVQFSLAEWDRLTDTLISLGAVMGKHLGDTRVVIPSQPLVAGRFKSPAIMDYARMHELFDQLVFRSKFRFQLHLRLLRRAMEILSAEVRRDCERAGRTEHRPPDFWRRLDIYFHDLDLIAKESLLSFRTLLSCLPHSSLPGLTRDVESMMRDGVRTHAAD
jgi:hypothetical protein